ncbi:unnamed protein product [Xylocopa violacea]|uniref:Spaetzle domain-containing protein n=1 Tax=Xylocopa violacea TaxID=135666 RepID=A0ABP1NSA2_XYLVO
MIFKHKNTKRGYGGRVLILVQLCFLTALIVRNVYAYPHQTDQSEGNTVQISDVSSSSDRELAQNDLEGFMETDERYDSRKRLQRDTSNCEDTDVSNTSNKIPSKSEQKGGLLQRQRRQSDKIVFPTRNTGRPPNCEGSTYCVNVDFYPEDAVKRILQRNESLRYLANVDVITDIGQRIDVADDTPLCLSTEEVVYPRKAMNKEKEWLTVINQDEFKQGVRVEKCSQESKSCRLISDFAQGYKTSCKQKFVYKQLTALKTDDHTVVQDNFAFPASCCCHVSFNGSPLTRIGLGTANSEKGQITSGKTIRTQ